MREPDKPLDEIRRLGTENREFQAKIIDLTAQAYKRIEEEAKYQALFHNMTEGVVLCSADGSIQSFNPAAEIIFGRDHVEITGHSLEELMALPESFEGSVFDFVRENQVANKDKIENPLIGRRSDGDFIPLQVYVSEVNIGGDISIL
jgi:PAS domain S-box-containing protein